MYFHHVLSTSTHPPQPTLTCKRPTKTNVNTTMMQTQSAPSCSWHLVGEESSFSRFSFMDEVLLLNVESTTPSLPSHPERSASVQRTVNILASPLPNGTPVLHSVCFGNSCFPHFWMRKAFEQEIPMARSRNVTSSPYAHHTNNHSACAHVPCAERHSRVSCTTLLLPIKESPVFRLALPRR